MGEHLLLRAKAIAENIWWFFRKPTALREVTFISRNDHLEIDSVDYDHSGIYYCLASGPKGYFLNDMEVLVYGIAS